MRSDHPGALCISAMTKGEIVFSRPQRPNFPARSQASPTLGTIIAKNSTPLCLSAAIGSPEGSPAGRPAGCFGCLQFVEDICRKEICLAYRMEAVAMNFWISEVLSAHGVQRRP